MLSVFKTVVHVVFDALNRCIGQKPTTNSKPKSLFDLQSIKIDTCSSLKNIPTEQRFIHAPMPKRLSVLINSDQIAQLEEHAQPRMIPVKTQVSAIPSKKHAHTIPAQSEPIAILPDRQSEIQHFYQHAASIVKENVKLIDQLSHLPACVQRHLADILEKCRSLFQSCSFMTQNVVKWTAKANVTLVRFRNGIVFDVRFRGTCITGTHANVQLQYSFGDYQVFVGRNNLFVLFSCVSSSDVMVWNYWSENRHLNVKNVSRVAARNPDDTENGFVRAPVASSVMALDTPLAQGIISYVVENAFSFEAIVCKTFFHQDSPEQYFLVPANDDKIFSSMFSGQAKVSRRRRAKNKLLTTFIHFPRTKHSRRPMTIEVQDLDQFSVETHATNRKDLLFATQWLQRNFNQSKFLCTSVPGGVRKPPFGYGFGPYGMMFLSRPLNVVLQGDSNNYHPHRIAYIGSSVASSSSGVITVSNFDKTRVLLKFSTNHKGYNITAIDQRDFQTDPEGRLIVYKFGREENLHDSPIVIIKMSIPKDAPIVPDDSCCKFRASAVHRVIGIWVLPLDQMQKCSKCMTAYAVVASEDGARYCGRCVASTTHQPKIHQVHSIQRIKIDSLGQRMQAQIGENDQPIKKPMRWLKLQWLHPSRERASAVPFIRMGSAKYRVGGTLPRISDFTMNNSTCNTSGYYFCNSVETLIDEMLHNNGAVSWQPNSGAEPLPCLSDGTELEKAESVERKTDINTDVVPKMGAAPHPCLLDGTEQKTGSVERKTDINTDVVPKMEAILDDWFGKQVEHESEADKSSSAWDHDVVVETKNLLNDAKESKVAPKVIDHLNCAPGASSQSEFAGLVSQIMYDQTTRRIVEAVPTEATEQSVSFVDVKVTEESVSDQPSVASKVNND